MEKRKGWIGQRTIGALLVKILCRYASLFVRVLQPLKLNPRFLRGWYADQCSAWL
jgi:hypothetical protein